MQDLICGLKNSPSVVISVCALLLTMSQAWATRKHNRLSVQPRLTTHLHIENDITNKKVTKVIATLTNSGLGPAIIKKFEILFKDDAYSINETDEFSKLIAVNLTAQLAKSAIGVMRTNHVLSKDATAELMNIEILNATPLNLLELEQFHVRVTYESAYNELFIYDSRLHKNLGSPID